MNADLYAMPPPLRLRPVHRIKSLVKEKADGKGLIDPKRHILIHSRVVLQCGQEVNYNEAEAG